jgi:hypothetical protein
MMLEQRQELLRLLEKGEGLSPERAWIDEAERRHADWKSERTKAVPAGQAITEMRRKLRGWIQL